MIWSFLSEIKINQIFVEKPSLKYILFNKSFHSTQINEIILSALGNSMRTTYLKHSRPLHTGKNDYLLIHQANAALRRKDTQ